MLDNILFVASSMYWAPDVDWAFNMGYLIPTPITDDKSPFHKWGNTADPLRHSYLNPCPYLNPSVPTAEGRGMSEFKGFMENTPQSQPRVARSRSRVVEARGTALTDSL